MIFAINVTTGINKPDFASTVMGPITAISAGMFVYGWIYRKSRVGGSVLVIGSYVLSVGVGLICGTIIYLVHILLS